MSDSDSAAPQFKKLHFPKLHKGYGMKNEAKVFYEVKDSDDNVKWVEYIPSTLAPAVRQRFDGAAIQIFKSRDEAVILNNVSIYKPSFIKVQSPFIIEKLKEILDHSQVTFKAQGVEIHHPFQQLYFVWDRIRLIQANSDQTQPASSHLAVLVKFMDEELGETFRTIQDLQKQGRITYNNLWAIYPKGTYVFSTKNGYNQAYRVVSSEMGGTWSRLFGGPGFWTIKCEYVQFDGYEYGFSETVFTISPFQGTKDINALEVVPWSFLPDPEARKKTLIERGRKALDYQSIHYLSYDGVGIQPEPNPESIQIPLWRGSKFNIVGRIIIDPYLYARQNEWLRRLIRPIRPPKGLEKHLEAAKKTDKPERRDRRDASQLATTTRPRPDEAEQKENRRLVEEDTDNLWIMSPQLDGFSLSEKRWTIFMVENLKPLQLDDMAYDDLVLVKESKELILSFARQHTFEYLTGDVISGKGEGLLILLSGPTGTGKTLTAEAVADKVGRPLYHIDTHEIGDSVEKISSNLRTIMNMAAEWNAIVLLDEADVFLQKRKFVNHLANEGVAVFLRELEYYRGTLFLTTNMLDNIDEAVESRIHMHIVFKRLDFAARKEIWRKNLKRTHYYEAQITEENIEEAAKWILNGRQIKNAIQMATKWSTKNQKNLSLDIIENVIRLTSPKAAKDDAASQSALAANGV